MFVGIGKTFLVIVHKVVADVPSREFSKQVEPQSSGRDHAILNCPSASQSIPSTVDNKHILGWHLNKSVSQQLFGEENYRELNWQQHNEAVRRLHAVHPEHE